MQWRSCTAPSLPDKGHEGMDPTSFAVWMEEGSGIREVISEGFFTWLPHGRKSPGYDTAAVTFDTKELLGGK